MALRFQKARLASITMMAATLASAASFAADEETWPGIRKELFGDRDVVVNEGRIALEAPVRADDAAVVPITIRIPAEHAAAAKAVTIVVDKNPAPVAATFTFGPAAGEGPRTIATRLRIDMYSNVRAILETTDGKLHMMSRYVKASGGCSAPALKDADMALAELGKMRVKSLPAAAGAPAEAQVMIRHPNYTGMQMDPISRSYTPALFVESIDVKQGSRTVFRMTGGISLSEDPNIRFSYANGGSAEPLSATARDTGGREFTARATPAGS